MSGWFSRCGSFRPWRDRLDELLLANERSRGGYRLTLVRLFEELRGLGYEGGYDAVQRYAKAWSKKRARPLLRPTYR